MVGFEQQRKNMVESQIRPSDITDRRIIRAMLELPRELFVPPAASAIAYMDQDLPLTPAGTAPRRWLLAPRLHAKLMQALDLGDQDMVLEVGCTTGYAAAVLSRFTRGVVAVESDAGLAAQARAALAACRTDHAAPSGAELGNVRLVVGPLTQGCATEGPYDAILISGAVTEMPAGLLDQLKDGGRLAVVVTDAGVSRLMQWRRIGSRYDARPVAEASAPALPGFERQPAFSF